LADFSFGRAILKRSGSGISRFVRVHDPEGNAIELWEPADD
jgi:predicted enzyme related to lactoylglutathione lyase